MNPREHLSMTALFDQVRLKLRHAGVTKDISLYEGITVTELHTVLRAAFPAAGVVAGIEDDKSTVFPLSAVCLKPTAFSNGVFNVVAALPHTEVRWMWHG